MRTGCSSSRVCLAQLILATALPLSIFATESQLCGHPAKPIDGDWLDPWNDHIKITRCTMSMFGIEYEITQVDLVDEHVIAFQVNDPWSTGDNGTYSRFEWTDYDGFHWYCDEVWGEPTLEEALTDPAIGGSDASDPATGGCGAFPWSELIPDTPEYLVGDWEDQWGTSVLVTNTTWSAYGATMNIRVVRLEKQLLVAYSETGDYAGTYSRIEWVEHDGASWWCDIAYDQPSLQAALDSPAIADASDPANGGCNDYAWSKLIRAGPSDAKGDPITTFQGRQTRYWLSTEHFTPVLEQGPFVLSQLAGPANPPPGLEDHKGDWVVATELKIAGMDTIRIEAVDPTTLLTPPNATAAPAAAANNRRLTTVRLSAGGKPLTAGEHTLSALNVTITARRVTGMALQQLAIGSGFAERIDIKATALHLRLTTSKANKFADETLQVLGLHLDLELLTIDERAVRGALPQMWGLQPMSEATKRLLDKPAGRAPVAA